MPEIKQNFIKGKMNKDLDERLIEKGEYREAQNIHVTESEGSDAGAIENILSNKSVSSIVANLGTSIRGEGYEVIGYCKDTAKKRIIYFITNYACPSFTDDIRSISRALDAGSITYGPYGDDCAIVMYDIENKAQHTLVHGEWLNLSKNHLITGVQIIEDLLFWTDNLNQPRKINIQKALENFVSKSNQYYDCEENISVAKYAPYKAIMLHNDDASSGLPSRDDQIKSDYIKEKFIRFSYRYKYDDGEYSLIAPFTQAVFEPLNKGIITNSFTDDEKNETVDEPEVLTGKKEVYKKGIVDIMQNAVNQVELRIPLPNKNEFTSGVGAPAAGSYDNPYNIKEIDILLKESDGISFKLVKTIKLEEVDSSNIDVYTMQPTSTSSMYNRSCLKYTYKSSEPYQVLPESEVNRVYDQVPIIAKTLEIVGNRVVFGNYVENYPYPTDINGKKGINYAIASTTKGGIDQAGIDSSEPYLYGLKQWMHKTYKYHTVKQRRTYQVGIVFSDIYGRQSPVILSSNTLERNADTYTMPEVTDIDFYNNTDGAWSSDSSDNAYAYGKSLSIEFKDNDLTDDLKFVASTYFGDSASQRKNYNPHGWYSYRIVVKQQEQEYYNVYAAHSFDGWDNIEHKPNNSLTGGRSWLSLYGDNINKIPRSLSSDDINRPGTMGSDVRLYPKVIFGGRSGGLLIGELDSAVITNAGAGITDPASPDDPYTTTVPNGLDAVTSGDGTGAEIELYVAGNVVVSVKVIKPGRGFKNGDTITINSNILPGATTDATLTLRTEDIYDRIGESKLNTTYHELTEVISLGTAFEQNLFISGDDNKSGTGGFSVLNFVYGKDKNPLVAELANMSAYSGSSTSNNAAKVLYTLGKTSTTKYTLAEDQTTTTKYDIQAHEFDNYSINTPLIDHLEELKVISVDASSAKEEITLSSHQNLTLGDKMVLSKYYEGLSVFETEPFVSKLDIYYETSTSGLVSDLVKEIVVNQEDLATNLRIEQDTYSSIPDSLFDSDQPPVSTLNESYGVIAYLYENFPTNTYIGDLSATAPSANPSATLTFEVSKATRIGDNSNASNKFSVALDGSTYKLKTTGGFVYNGSNLDKYNVTIKVTDSSTSQSAYLYVIVEVKNSAPVISTLNSEILLRADVGDSFALISSSNNIENGSTVTGGDVNKYNDLEVAFSFGDTSLNKYFKKSDTTPQDKYEIITTSLFTVANSEDFFAASDSDRTLTITLTDNGGLTDTTSTIIKEDPLVVINMKTRKLSNAITKTSEVSGAIDSDVFDTWVTQGTSGDDPEVADGTFGSINFYRVYVGNSIYINQALSQDLSSGYYLISWDFNYDYDGLIVYAVLAVDSNGYITSVTTLTNN